MIGTRIKSVRNHLGLNQVDFSRVLGISQSFLSSVERNEQVPGSDTILSLKRYFKSLNTDWLIAGEGSMLNKSEIKESEVYEEPNKIKALEEKVEWLVQQVKGSRLQAVVNDGEAVTIPLFTEPAAAGFGLSAYSEEFTPFPVSRRFIRRPSESFAVRVLGQSMVGAGILSGDIAVVERGYEPLPNAIMLFRLNENEYTIKQLEDKNGVFRLKSANSKVPSLQITAEVQAQIVGRIILILRQL